ncbi:uncharacterized protein [Triticum aestivum]|uniref:uncharacterized protein n=1 Tax=Triticum aestivum TaxID=4565 RepID=UPI001D02779A|nr:uncharacterized protein LOC123065562 [Triticum aestivum]
MMTSILGVAVNWMEYNELREEDTASAHLLLSLCEARMFASAFQFVVRLCDVLRTPHRQPGPPESLRQQHQNLNAREVVLQTLQHNLQTLQHNLHTLETTLTQKDNDLRVLSTELDGTQKTLEDQTASLLTNRRDLDQTRQGLIAREARLVASETALQQLHNQLVNRREELIDLQIQVVHLTMLLDEMNGIVVPPAEAPLQPLPPARAGPGPGLQALILQYGTMAPQVVGGINRRIGAAQGPAQGAAQAPAQGAGADDGVPAKGAAQAPAQGPGAAQVPAQGAGAADGAQGAAQAGAGQDVHGAAPDVE